MPVRLLGSIIALLVLISCRAEDATRPAPVVVYSSVDEVFARPIAERFQQETGIEVRLVPDTEETKSTGLLNRLMAEKDRPQADVFWSGDPVRAVILKSRGVSAPYLSPQAEGLPAQFSDSEGHWTGFSARARVLIYNRNLVPAGQEPKSVMDLIDARFKGKAVGFVYPDQEGMGVLVIPNSVVLVAGGPNPDGGKRFIDYLLLPKTEQALAESEATQMPVRPGVPVPQGVTPLDQLKPMPVDYAMLGSLLDQLAAGYLKDWVDRNSR